MTGRTSVRFPAWFATSKRTQVKNPTHVVGVEKALVSNSTLISHREYIQEETPKAVSLVRFKPSNKPENSHRKEILWWYWTWRKRASELQRKEEHRVQLGETPSKCWECGNSFGLNSHFIRHQRTHTREKPYWCSGPRSLSELNPSDSPKDTCGREALQVSWMRWVLQSDVQCDQAPENPHRRETLQMCWLWNALCRIAYLCYHHKTHIQVFLASSRGDFLHEWT